MTAAQQCANSDKDQGMLNVAPKCSLVPAWMSATGSRQLQQLPVWTLPIA